MRATYKLLIIIFTFLTIIVSANATLYTFDTSSNQGNYTIDHGVCSDNAVHSTDYRQQDDVYCSQTGVLTTNAGFDDRDDSRVDGLATDKSSFMFFQVITDLNGGTLNNISFDFEGFINNAGTNNGHQYLWNHTGGKWEVFNTWSGGSVDVNKTSYTTNTDFINSSGHISMLIYSDEDWRQIKTDYIELKVDMTFNTAPDDISIKLNASNADNRTNRDLTCSFTPTDSDAGETLIADISWFNGTTRLIKYEDVSVTQDTLYTHSIDSVNTSKGEVWKCEVQVCDDDSSCNTLTNSSGLTILNTPPSITAPSINNSNPETNDVIQCDPGSSSDDDGDSVTPSYRWFDDDVVVAGETSQTLDLSGSGLDDGDEIICETTPNDGTDNGDPINSTGVNIKDSTPPYFTSISVNDSTPLWYDTVNFSVTINEDFTLSSYIFSWDNGTGNWVNDTPITISGSATSVSVIKNISNIGTINYKWFANNSVNLWNNTDSNSVTASDKLTISSYVFPQNWVLPSQTIYLNFTYSSFNNATDCWYYLDEDFSTKHFGTVNTATKLCYALNHAPTTEGDHNFTPSFNTTNNDNFNGTIQQFVLLNRTEHSIKINAPGSNKYTIGTNITGNKVDTITNPGSITANSVLLIINNPHERWANTTQISFSDDINSGVTNNYTSNYTQKVAFEKTYSITDMGIINEYQVYNYTGVINYSTNNASSYSIEYFFLYSRLTNMAGRISARDKWYVDGVQTNVSGTVASPNSTLLRTVGLNEGLHYFTFTYELETGFGGDGDAAGGGGGDTTVFSVFDEVLPSCSINVEPASFLIKKDENLKELVITNNHNSTLYPEFMLDSHLTDLISIKSVSNINIGETHSIAIVKNYVPNSTETGRITIKFRDCDSIQVSLTIEGESDRKSVDSIMNTIKNFGKDIIKDLKTKLFTTKLPFSNKTYDVKNWAFIIIYGIIFMGLFFTKSSIHNKIISWIIFVPICTIGTIFLLHLFI